VSILAACSIASVGRAETGQAPAETGETPSEAGIFAVVDQFNALGIAIAGLAVEKGQSDPVRGLGRSIVDEQKALQAKGRALGRRLGIFVRPAKDELGSYAITVARLRETAANQFDVAYLKQELVLERNVIDALIRMLPSAKLPEFAEFLAEAVRTFEAHLAATQAVARTMAVD
jgi:predicted outer membrane protein